MPTDGALCSYVSSEKNKGKGENVAASAKIDEFASQFDRKFAFMASTLLLQWHHPRGSSMLTAGLLDI